jgi:hypothetical protein
MPAPISIDQLREQAEAVLADADARLEVLRAEKHNIQTAIKATVMERDEAKSVVKKLTPRKKKEAAVEEPTEELPADAEDIADAQALADAIV